MWTHTFQAFAVVGLGFLVAHLLAQTLMRRALLHAGVLFVGLGVLSGPMALDVVGLTGVDVTPLAMLVVGWVGLQVGLGLSARQDGGLVAGSIRAGLIYALIAMVALGAAAYGLLWGLLDAPVGDAMLAASVIAAAGVSGAPHALRVVWARLGAGGPVSDASESLARAIRVAATLAFAGAAVLTTRPELGIVGELAPTGWLLGELALGLAVGLVADFFLGDDPDDRRLVVSLMAVSAFATGVALHLGQSPLLPNLVLGLVLANFGGRQALRHRAVTGLEQPTLYVLLVWAGATWVLPDQPLALLIAGALILVRILAAGYAGSLAAQALDPTNRALRRMGFAVVGQGAPPVALAIAWATIPSAPFANLVLTVVVVSVIVNDLWSVAAARMVLDEAGEIPTLLPET